MKTFIAVFFALSLITSAFSSERTYKYECYSTHYGKNEWDPENAYLKAQFILVESNDNYKATIKVDYNKSTSHEPKNWRLNSGETIAFKPLTQEMVPAWRKLDTFKFAYFTAKNIGNAVVEITLNRYTIGSNEIGIGYSIEAIPATKDDPAYGTSASLICRTK